MEVHGLMCSALPNLELHCEAHGLAWERRNTYVMCSALSKLAQCASLRT
jgi:hypothetical protein